MNANVASGAQLLDEKIPGWYRRIDLETLDLSDARICICGQLSGVGDWAPVANHLYGGEYEPGWDTFVVQHGFCSNGLNRESWVEAINARLAHDALEAPAVEEFVIT